MTVKNAVNSGWTYNYKLDIKDIKTKKTIFSYIGMGKGKRIYSHMEDVIKGKHKNKFLTDALKKVLQKKATLEYSIIGDIDWNRNIILRREKSDIRKNASKKLCNITHNIYHKK